MSVYFKSAYFLGLAILLVSCVGSTEKNKLQFKPEPVYLDNKTYAYHALIEAYAKLAAQHSNAKLIEIGNTDENLPLHAYLFASKKEALSQYNKPNENRLTILINNGIHPGEPAGIDASLQLAYSLQENFDQFLEEHPNTLLAIIPTFNVGGTINRGCCSRANQVGPEEYGYRGNSKNLDLNRDFAKADALETRALQDFFTQLNPDFFIDNHTTNGADYPYVMTFISPQYDMAGKILGRAVKDWVNPFIFKYMQEKQVPTQYYISVFGKDPKLGFDGTGSTPRYAAGFTNLFRTFSFLTEGHMLKTYPERVEATIHFMEAILALGSAEKEKIKRIRNRALQYDLAAKYYTTNWEVRRDTFSLLPFSGYEMVKEPSQVTGLQRRKFRQDMPFDTVVPYYTFYKAVDSVSIPDYYIVPFAHQDVIERLKAVNIQYEEFKEPKTVTGNFYTITNFQLESRPYEGRVLLKYLEYAENLATVHYAAGSIKIPTKQPAKRYIIEMLEPKAPDSFLRWGFFNGWLQQKEWFSDYLFEDIAAELLASDAQLRTDFEAEKLNNPDLANNSWAQLYFIYKRSPYHSESVFRYPVARIFE
ncbi:MAG: M14 family zinc carboxypeptidase [Luteibaculaceae bacterium]